MDSEIKIEKLDPSDEDSIRKIAHWYFDEWDTPIEKTLWRLSNQPSQDTLFQLVLSSNQKVVATGGLCNNVNIYKVHPRLKKFSPWIGLLYTQKEYRNNGLGTMLLKEIERCAAENDLNKIYLYTFTAESLYQRGGWKEIDRVMYKDHDTAVMEKVL
ncbi:MAG: GNAT family N-acetyltransferase [Balneolaceae bacterium]|jgi:GNAT superfamily N-acetyltransferase